MTDEERKRKIVEIISPYVVERWHDKIAGALIKAWIGDVSSEKAMRELAEAFHREKCAEYDLLNYQMQKLEYRVVEAEHRAEVAERAVYNMAYGQWQREGARRVICEKYAPSTVRDYLARAEKELEEERKDE